MPKKEKWIQKAKLKEGALTNYLKNTFGKKAFAKNGTIKKSVLRDLAAGKKVYGVKPNLTTRRRAQLALNINK